MNDTSWPTWARPVALGRAGAAAVVAAAISGALLALWFALMVRSRAPSDYVVCALPALLTAALAATSQADRRQYLARLAAAMAMAPLLVGFWATDAPGPWTLPKILTLILWFVAHLALFVGLIAWLASATTRVEPAVPAAAEAARQRFAQALELLAAGEPRLALHGQGPAWELDCTQAEDRLLRIQMRLDASDATQVALRVREVSTAAGAAPANADEASMRSLGDPIHDATRPDAQRVWSASWAATVLEPEKLAALRFEPASDRPSSATLAAAAAHSETLVHLLAALALRAGLAWQPTLARP